MRRWLRATRCARARRCSGTPPTSSAIRRCATGARSAAHPRTATRPPTIPAALLALDATFTIAGAGGERQIGAGDFFRGMFETALASTDVLTAIAFDAAPASAYVKFHHPARTTRSSARRRC